MFLNTKYGGYNRHGEQTAGGAFLILFNRVSNEGWPTDPTVPFFRPPAERRELRCLVRYVRMTQFGHFMMGRVRVGEHKLGLSGSYGADGLPCDPPPNLWERLHPLPTTLAELYWKSDGHNSSGAEGPALRTWALENLSTLKKLR